MLLFWSLAMFMCFLFNLLELSYVLIYVVWSIRPQIQEIALRLKVSLASVKSLDYAICSAFWLTKSELAFRFSIIIAKHVLVNAPFTFDNKFNQEIFLSNHVLPHVSNGIMYIELYYP